MHRTVEQTSLVVCRRLKAPRGYSVPPRPATSRSVAQLGRPIGRMQHPERITGMLASTQDFYAHHQGPDILSGPRSVDPHRLLMHRRRPHLPTLTQSIPGYGWYTRARIQDAKIPYSARQFLLFAIP